MSGPVELAPVGPTYEIEILAHCRVTSTKEMKWNGTKITYTPRKTYVFDPDHSYGSLSDTITTLNPGAMLLAGMGAGPKLTKIFDTGTIQQFLFDG